LSLLTNQNYLDFAKYRIDNNSDVLSMKDKEECNIDND
jgi:hypothetical protein